MAVVKHNKIKLREVNRHLVCRLCRGYYIDATTIAECLHSFCRSCIIKYLEKNSFCPVCEVQIHKTKPYLNLRLDKALQDVVYKLVPGLYHDEMKRRREFYAKHQDQLPTTTPEQCGLEERIIFSPDDSISLSLEYLESDDFESETVSSQCSESSGDNQDSLSFPQQLGLMKLKSNDGKSSRRESQDVQESSSSSFPKRYLQCPAGVSVFHLKKFIRMKHDLTDKMQVDIVHKRVPLPDHYTLMDVAYIYTWKRSAPMRFLYQIIEAKRPRTKVSNSLPILEEYMPVKQETNKMLSLVNGDAKSSLKAEPGQKPEEGPMGAKAKCKLPLTNGPVEPKSDVNKTLSNDIKPFAMNDTSKKTDISSLRAEVNAEPSGEKSSVIANGGVSSDGQKARTERKSVDSSAKENERVKSESGGEAKSSEGKGTTEKGGSSPQVQSVTSSNGNVNGSIQDPKEQVQVNGGDRLFLNPISGQFESVPSTVQCKSNGKSETVQVEKKVDALNAAKKSISEPKPKKVNGEGQKEVKKSSVDLLKSFRKDKSTGCRDVKTDGKTGSENALTITPIGKQTKLAQKEGSKVSLEVKTEKKESEYDFDGTSPPSKIIPLQEYSKMSKSQKLSKGEGQPQNSWMSLQDFRLQMLKENNLNLDEAGKKEKRKSVPSLFRIGADGNKKPNPKAMANGKSAAEKVKTKMSPTIINIKTENENSSKTEIKIELPSEEPVAPPKSVKSESKADEYVVKQKDEEPKKLTAKTSTPPEAEKTEEDRRKSESVKTKDQSAKRSSPEKPESDNPKKSKPTVEETTNNDNFGAIDLSKNDASPKSGKNPLENLMDLANKSGTPKSDENMVEALISAAQKQSIEPLLKIPHYSQNAKTSGSQGSSPPLAKSISSTDISQALQFFKDLRSDIKVLEAKSQLSPNSFLEQFAHNSANLEPIQLYQQHIDLIRRLKRQHQMAANEAEAPQRKQTKLSPPSDSKRKSSAETKMSEEAAAQLKSSLERTLSQIQEQMELQSRMVAAQNYKNLPALLQFYSRPPPAFCPLPPISPSKSSQSKLRANSSSRSPNSQKSPPMARSSPQSLTPPGPGPGPLPLPLPNAESPFFPAQKYNHLINAGLNSEMTFHQMFQNYLSQQDKMNQIKHSSGHGKKPQGSDVVLPKSVPELLYGAQGGPGGAVKKPEAGTVGPVQKT